MQLTGHVQSGEGNAAYWLAKDADAYRLWTGVDIVPGSLNVLLSTKFDWAAAEIAPYLRVFSLVPFGGNRDILLVPCEISTDRHASPVPAFAWATTIAAAAPAPDYHVLELIAPLNLRQTLTLPDQTSVTISIPMPWPIDQQPEH